MIDILIIEDNEELGELIQDFLEAAGYDTYLAPSGEEGLAVYQEERARLVLLDLMLPGRDGYQVCNEIRKKENVPVLLMSAKNQKEDKLLGFEVGADDYIEKPFDIDILIAKIQSILRRDAKGVGDVLTDGDLWIDKSEQIVKKDGNQIEMTQKEFQLLCLFVENKGKNLKKEWMFDQVWGVDSFSEPSTLTVHIKMLRNKIEENPGKPQRILTVWGVGYKYEGVS